MNLTARQLTAREDAILDALEHFSDGTFRGKLYRDGVPSPSTYLAQSVRVLFVFREPNMRGVPYALDMRDEVRDRHFRPLRDSKREERSVRSWWNNKVGLFAHAVAAALEDKPMSPSFKDFATVIERGEWHHAVVNRFGYIQIKKLGGGGSCNEDEIREHVKKYGTTLKNQIELYRPHMIIGCGVGKASPAQLLRPLLGEGREDTTSASGATWWRFSTAWGPMAMLQLYHPAKRGRTSELYSDVWCSVREVTSKTAIDCRDTD